MRIFFLLLPGALLALRGNALASGTSADALLPTSSDLRGVYIYTALDAKDGSAEAQAVDSSLKLPGADGMLLVGLWSSIEPSRGQYAWAALDHWVGLADSLGKKITLAIRAGDGTPSWLFLPPPSGAGAQPLTFTISPHEGKTGQCDTETIAPPWDTAYLTQWDSLLIAVAAHLKSKGTYGAITALRLTGINRTSDELRLPAETAQSTGLPCVSNADSIWQHALYRPSKLLAAWDAVTNSFQESFPDKAFSVAIITNPPQVPFPAIAEDGSLITGTLADQNQPLLSLAAQKFPGRLAVQFNFLLPGTPANPFVIQASQTLGTLVAYQTNNFYSLSDSGAACGGTPASPMPCDLPGYMQLLETGIYPLGQSYSLRAQYIELWPINAIAFPQDVQQAHTELFASPLAQQISITPGTPQQLFHLRQTDAMGMTGVPDMHTAILQEPDSSYRLWIAGRFYADSVEGATGLITTRDFLHFTPVGNATTAQVVLPPSCRPGSVACWDDYDADYTGADGVYRATNGKDLLMLYHGQTKYYGVRPPNRATDPSWCVLGLARSTDEGISWARQGAVLSGSDPKPDTIPPQGIYGVVEPGTIVANGFIYAFYAYFPTPGYPDAGPPTIQVARAPVDSDGAPGSWTKYCSGSFGSQPGLGGLGSQVVPTVFSDNRPAQPWPVFSTYLNAYVLLFLCQGGWYFSTSTDLVTWAVPERYFASPVGEFTAGMPTDENVIMVTPGYPAQIIGQTGYVLYAHTPAWGDTAHELWMRPFAFNSQTTDVHTNPAAVPRAYVLRQNFPNPFNPSTVIRFELPSLSDTKLVVYDILGREVTTLVNERKGPGTYEARFDASHLASGVYFYRLTAGPFVVTRRMVLIR